MGVTTAHTSITRKELVLIHWAPYVSSGTAITDASDVSLKREMKALLRDGSTTRNMVGSRTWRSRCQRVSPMAMPASISPRGTASSPARKTSTR